jgi:protein-disulfide isomerase-like protein with CxxC motif
MRTDVDFWFDPVCPWAWLTSRWILEVEAVRPVTAHWHVMSLAMLNEDNDVSDDYRSKMWTWLGAVRVISAAERRSGSDVVLPLYSALGARIHLDGRRDFESIVSEALAETGLPTDLMASFHDESEDAAVRASHRRALELVGQDVGTPVISIRSADRSPVAFFGPVLSRTPIGETAGRLWDAARVMAEYPHFFEMKRSRTEEAQFG